MSQIEKIDPVIGGVAHTVFCIDAGGDTYYLKIRYDRFVSLPHILCNPEDIDIEYEALNEFGNAEIDGVSMKGKTVILTTSAGTKGIGRAVNADTIITGAFVNSQAFFCSR